MFQPNLVFPSRLEKSGLGFTFSVLFIEIVERRRFSARSLYRNNRKSIFFRMAFAVISEVKRNADSRGCKTGVRRIAGIASLLDFRRIVNPVAVTVVMARIQR